MRQAAVRLRQCAALSPVGLRPRPAGRAAAHEHGVGKSLGPRDADLRRADGVRDLPALLEPAPEHRPRRDRSPRATRPVLSRAPGHGDRGQRRRGRPGAPRPPRRASTTSPPGSSSCVRSRARRTRSASPSSSSRTPRTSTCTGHPRSRSSPAPAATSATGASGSRTRLTSPSGCCAQTRSGPGRGSTPRCRAPRPTQVNLKEKLTVFIFYDTAYVDSKGVVYFAHDYYGHDAQLDKALGHGYPYPRKS